jgi:RNA polymerase sigma-70 factor (sigma-E family)
VRGSGVKQRADEFAVFYETARDDCLRTVAAWTLDRAAAEDLVAEAFARAWASWRRVRVHPSPRAWVVRTALNANVSAWRRYRREHERSFPDTSLTDLRPEGESTFLDEDVLAALRGLPERQRQVLALRVFLDLDVAQTASTLRIAEGTVNAHLSRAMTRLRAELALTTRSETRA